MIVGAEHSDLPFAIHDRFSVLHKEDASGISLTMWQPRASRGLPLESYLGGYSDSTSVPAAARLRVLRLPPMRWARSRMPVMPQWPSLPASSTSGWTPRPSSRTKTLRSFGPYSSSISMCVAPEWWNALTGLAADSMDFVSNDRLQRSRTYLDNHAMNGVTDANACFALAKRRSSSERRFLGIAARERHCVLRQ